jgi:hypothetical protein
LYLLLSGSICEIGQDNILFPPALLLSSPPSARLPGGLRAQTTLATMMSHTSERQARGIRQVQLGGHQFAEELQGPVDKGAVPHNLPGTVRISV